MIPLAAASGVPRLVLLILPLQELLGWRSGVWAKSGQLTYELRKQTEGLWVYLWLTLALMCQLLASVLASVADSSIPILGSPFPFTALVPSAAA